MAAGGAALSAVLGGGSSAPKAKAVPAARALEALAADEACLLIDIRTKAEIKATGGPNLKGVSKRGAVSVPYVVAVKVRRRVCPAPACREAASWEVPEHCSCPAWLPA